MTVYKHLFNSFLIICVIAILPASSMAFDGESQGADKALEHKVQEIEKSLSAQIGITLLSTDGRSSWSYKGNQRFPLMSTFKTFACAKLLKNVEAQESNLDSTVRLNKQILVTYSPVTEKRIGQDFSLGEACNATMLTSDNTAANIVLQEIGGPAALTQFMRGIGDSISRLDRFETELNEATPGDLRDTTTPNAIAKSLQQILFADVLHTQSIQTIKQWMIDNQTADSLLRSVLPEDWIIGDRTGAGGHGSRAITAVVWPVDQPALIIAIYITQTEASFKRRNEAITKIGQEIFTYLSRKDNAH